MSDETSSSWFEIFSYITKLGKLSAYQSKKPITAKAFSISMVGNNTKHCSSLLMGACQFKVAFQNMGVIYVNRSIRHTSSKYFIIFQLLWSDGFRVFT